MTFLDNSWSVTTKFIEFVLNAPIQYKHWWLNLVAEAPAHVFVETCLTFFIVWLLLIRRTVDPSRSSDNKTLNSKEITELIDSWEPESIVPTLGDEEEEIAENIQVVESFAGNYVKLKNIDTKILNLTSFDFLGLSNSVEIKDIAREALDKYGCGSCGPRGFYGTIDQHLKIENAIAKFLGTEEAISYSDSASTVSSVIPAFAKKGDLLVVDDGCCETVLTGANLSRSTVVFFKHNDMQDLEDVLSAIAEDDVRHKRKAIEQRRFIIAEGLYRNSGNICPLPALLRIKEKYFYRLILDETLSFGSLGKTGRGLTEYFDVPVDSVEILIVSMDTSLGSVGGLCVGRRDIVEHQRLSGAGYCFSASAPPFLSAAAVQALSQMEKAPELLKSLQENAVLLWNGIRNIHGLRVLGTIPAPVIHVAFDQQIVTVPLKREIAMICALSQKLLLAGIGASTSKFSILRSDSKNAQQPTIRVCSRATLSTEEVARVLDAIRGVTKALLREEGFTFPPTPTR